MIRIKKRIGLPLSITLSTLVAMVLLMGLSSPVNKISYAIVFFLLFLVFLISLGYSVISMQFGQVTPKAKYRIIIISSLIVLAIMLRSVQSLNLVDLLIVGLISFGLIFYTSRRG
jgi:hypothetical protein